MKRCPQCRRDYYDETLNFCLDDGTALVTGPGDIHSTRPPSSVSDQPTMIHSTAVPDSGSSTSFMPAQARYVANQNAIAVLPFANMSPNNDTEYLSDGLAEELLNVLSRIDGLRVAGRTSAFSFKGKQTTFAEIGRQLNVSSVLEGSVRTAGDRVRISVQLVNVSDGFHLWSQTYDRTMDDIFAIQDDIAASVVEEVRTKLVDRRADPSLVRRVKVEIADAVKDRAIDPEAHRQMLLGRHFAYRQTPEDTERAVGHFEKALEIEPNVAQCWVELGIMRFRQAGNGLIDPESGFEDVKEHARRALSIRGDLASAHALVAYLLLLVEFDFTGSYRAIHKALESEPDNTYVLLTCGMISRRVGKFAEAAEIFRHVIETDPLNVGAYVGLGTTFLHSGRLDEAEDCLRKALELSHSAVTVPAFLSLVLLGQGRIEEARAEVKNETVRVWRDWAQAIIETAADRPNEAETILDGYIREHREAGALQIAEIYAAMERPDEAFEYLELALSKRDPGISSIVVSPYLRPLYPDPRWQPLLRKIGIAEEYWPAI
jgi:TolB-like protein